MKAIAMAMAMVAALALAGCATMPVPAVVSQDGAGGTCDTKRTGNLIGRVFAARKFAELRRRTGASTVRVIRPGEAVTMDYRADRVNVELDERGLISAIRCG